VLEASAGNGILVDVGDEELAPRRPEILGARGGSDVGFQEG